MKKIIKMFVLMIFALNLKGQGKEFKKVRVVGSVELITVPKEKIPKLPPEIVKKIEDKYPKTYEEYYKRYIEPVKGKIAEEFLPSFEDIKEEMEREKRVALFNYYLEKNGINLDSFRFKIYRIFEKRRGFKDFVKVMKERKGAIYEASHGLRAFLERVYGFGLEKTMLVYADVIIKGKILYIEKHPTDMFYEKWVYIKVDSVILGKCDSDTIIVKSARVFGTGIEGFLVFERDVGDKGFFFLTKFPFSKYLETPDVIREYYWNALDGKKVPAFFYALEDSLKKFALSKDYKFPELKKGEYQSMPYVGYLKIFEGKYLAWDSSRHTYFESGVSPSSFFEVLKKYFEEKRRR